MKKAELDNRFPLFYLPPLLIPAHLSPPASCPQHSPARHEQKNPAGTIRVPNGINFALIKHYFFDGLSANFTLQGL